ncbi:RNA polymerase alpha subunit (chloroplast) [Nannochloropsis oceanica]|uniref:DNA-directed RNA polymerase alpha chain n=1 Tax=Nannochloropsis oceanica TaxID=145522 RepID=T1RIZ6_9STRA|nr:RNA polymerase alpha subunit [Nannochloropsis oceanica]AGI98873.1 RNA polymerase alpha subunit [Nannochloropsis oceanica]AGI99372.1 RNA polymerase alpha subunit [Nannochloropsis oceanica]AHX25283.1 DNA-directed RNA polymerase alpha chain [Nannochloropsis oceanica]
MKTEKQRLVIEIEKRTVDKRTGHISFQFRIGPFKKTMGTTIGAALRRTLLSLSKTLAITSACGNFNNGNSIREDLFELSLNLQRIHIKSSFFPYIGTARIQKVGPAIITAQDLKLDEGLEVINPYQYICTLNGSYPLDLHIMISSPEVNQGSDHIDPINPVKTTNKNLLKLREADINNIFGASTNSFSENLKKQNSEFNLSVEKSKKLLANLNNLKTLKDSRSNIIKTNLKDSKIKLNPPQKLPLDIIVVDPIYSSIQSCGFEVIQTTNSSVSEYEELIKRGVTDTEEFLKFVVVSRGDIEPAAAIELAVLELQETLTILEPLPHVYASEKNLLLALEMSSQFMLTQKIRDSLVDSYTIELLKKLDLKHLNLPVNLELLLRREGFVTLQNLISIPLELFKRIGLKENDLVSIEKSLNSFGLSINLDKNLKWELIPNSLPL